MARRRLGCGGEDAPPVLLPAPRHRRGRGLMSNSSPVAEVLSGMAQATSRDRRDHAVHRGQ
jgi:hypothetical protein